MLVAGAVGSVLTDQTCALRVYVAGDRICVCGYRVRRRLQHGRGCRGGQLQNNQLAACC